MKQINFLKMYKYLCNQKKKMLIRKGHDYSNKNNFFDTFEMVSFLSGINIEQEFLVYLCTKILRLSELFKNKKKPKFETIEDTLIDLSNYCDLFICYLREKNKT